ncbi:hypothetical protein [Weissella viridescens]|uniref:hypothetical protein n=1 Tax=Weissella viridescens TaxID=1629 RepID=UPI00092EBCCF|nr:hypothetical protein [Weissella viridescens]
MAQRELFTQPFYTKTIDAIKELSRTINTDINFHQLPTDIQDEAVNQLQAINATFDSDFKAFKQAQVDTMEMLKKKYTEANTAYIDPTSEMLNRQDFETTLELMDVTGFKEYVNALKPEDKLKNWQFLMIKKTFARLKPEFSDREYRELSTNFELYVQQNNVTQLFKNTDDYKKAEKLYNQTFAIRTGNIWGQKSLWDELDMGDCFFGETPQDYNTIQFTEIYNAFFQRIRKYATSQGINYDAKPYPKF